MRKRILFLLFSIELITISCNAYYEEYGDISPYALNEILYITKIGTPIELDAFDGWGATLLFNVYENGLGRIIFGEIVTHIPSRAFKNSNELRAIYIPEGIIYIGNNIFDSCNNLELIIGGKRVTSIGPSAFSGCTGELVLNCNNCLGLYGGEFAKLVIGDGVTSIGENAAFRGHSCLTSVTIGNSVTEIGEGAFYNCRNLTSVYCIATTPPTGGDLMFDGNASDRKIYVPRKSVEIYKSTKGWSEYANDIIGYDF